MPSKFIKQIKYLYQTSRHIIHEYGLVYFINFGFSQLRNQKLDLFKSEGINENIPQRKIQKKIDYDTWSKNHTKLLGESSFLLQYSPKVSFLMFVHNTDSLDDAMASIIDQSYPNWELKIISTYNNHDDLKFIDNRIQFKIINSNDKDIVEQISKTDSEFVCFMTNKIILDKNALFQLVKSLNENPISDIVYSDEEREQTDHTARPFFKPDWSPYLFLFTNYIGSFFMIRKTILVKTVPDMKILNGIFFGFLLKTTEITLNIYHHPNILFKQLLDKKNISVELNQKTISEALRRRNLDANVILDEQKTNRVLFNLNKEPKVTIIIPTRDNVKFLSKCLRSLEYNTNYKNMEIIIVNNNSNKETKSFLDSLPYKIINYNEKFNFSKLNNIASLSSTGEYMLFLNDDVEAIEPNWLKEMISLCKLDNIAIVGAKLLYNDNTIQHAGMVYMKNGFYFHPYQKHPSNTDKNFGIINSICERSAVTGACLLIQSSIFKEIGGFDEIFDVYYGDSDLCLSVQKLGYKVLYNPYAVLRHDGSSKIRSIAKIFIPVENHHDFIKKWPSLINGDPYYNSNLGFDYELQDVESFYAQTQPQI